MVKNPLFYQPNRSFDFGKKKYLYQYTLFFLHIYLHFTMKKANN